MSVIRRSIAPMGNTIHAKEVQEIVPGVISVAMAPCSNCGKRKPPISISGKLFCSGCRVPFPETFVAQTVEQFNSARIAARAKGTDICGAALVRGGYCIAFRDYSAPSEQDVYCSKCNVRQRPGVTYEQDQYAENSSLVPHGRSASTTEDQVVSSGYMTKADRIKEAKKDNLTQDLMNSVRLRNDKVGKSTKLTTMFPQVDEAIVKKAQALWRKHAAIQGRERRDESCLLFAMWSCGLAMTFSDLAEWQFVEMNATDVERGIITERGEQQFLRLSNIFEKRVHKHEGAFNHFLVSVSDKMGDVALPFLGLVNDCIVRVLRRFAHSKYFTQALAMAKYYVDRWEALCEGYLSKGLTCQYSKRLLDVNRKDMLVGKQQATGVSLMRRFTINAFLVLKWVNRDFDNRLFDFDGADFDEKTVQDRIAGFLDQKMRWDEDERQLYKSFPNFKLEAIRVFKKHFLANRNRKVALGLLPPLEDGELESLIRDIFERKSVKMQQHMAIAFGIPLGDTTIKSEPVAASPLPGTAKVDKTKSNKVKKESPELPEVGEKLPIANKSNRTRTKKAVNQGEVHTMEDVAVHGRSKRKRGVKS